MIHKKITAVMVGVAAATLLLIPGTAQADVERDSIACDKPKGNFARYSWGTEGATDATIYFNNHCDHAVSAKINFERKGEVGDKATKTRCMTVNARTSGSKEFTAYFYTPFSVTKVASC